MNESFFSKMAIDQNLVVGNRDIQNVCSKEETEGRFPQN
jgi:hypothetical protein